jgi:hypothetical protein
MAKTRTALDNEIRKGFTSKILEFFGEDGMQVGNANVAIPAVDSEGNEVWVEVSVKVPKGEKIPNTKPAEYIPYDGYVMAEEYLADKKAKAEKAEEKRLAKEKNIAKKKKEAKEKGE